MIKLENATKVFKGDSFETIALNDISLTIEEGEFVAVMGKSGSGKTTLLNIIGCMDNLSEGSYLLDDKDVSRYGSYKLDKMRKEKISFVFQSYALMQQYTVYENIELPLNARNIGYKEKKKRIRLVMEQLGITDLAKKYPRQISGGEQQRTAIARAIVADCNYILADEPTGALDGINSKELMDIFTSLNKEGKTIIMVTHDSEVASYAQRIINLEDGNIK